MDGERGGKERPGLVVGVLGGLEISLAGRPVPVGAARQRSVLAALLLEAGRVVPVDGLVDRVWGERAPARARSVLRTYLSQLRRALAGTGIGITWCGTGYLLSVDPDCVDVHRFRGLLTRAREQEDPRRALELVERALALWRGEPLAESDTPWARVVREGLRRERAAAEAERVDWALRRGDHQALLPELAARADAHPLDERAAEQLMLALYRSGRQADALLHYERTRRRLAEELGADPGPALRELHRRILVADTALDPPAGGDAVAPRQLPAPPAPFVGREDELDRLDSLLGNGGDTVPVCAIAGAGGIGKTWLALHWAHRNLHRFPDGQLFVDLRGFGPDSAPVPSEVAVRGFLDAFGVEEAKVPADPQARAALFRSLVAGKRVLVVLDNAADTVQLTPLLPGSPTCAVVVTSRNQLPGLITGHAADHLPLDVLPDAEARALLTDRLGAARVGAEPAAVDELIALCGGFPLALSIIAGQARTRPRVALASLAAELREHGPGALDGVDPSASLPSVLSWSLRALTAEQAGALALLAIAPGPDIDEAAAAALFPDRTRAVLRGLEQASLITQDERGRYLVHDLIRRHAAQHAPEREEEALRRVVDFYLHTAHAADRHLNAERDPIRLTPPAAGVRLRPPGDTTAALAWFDAEHQCLLAAQRAAAARGWHRTAWELAWCLSTFHYRRGHFHDQLAVWRVGLAAAQHLADPAGRAVAHRRLGSACTELGRPEEAIGHLDRALVLAERQRDRTQQIRTRWTLAGAWDALGSDRSLEHADHALRLCRELGNPVWEARALNVAGWCSTRRGHHDRAREHCRAALALYRGHGAHDGEADTLDSLGHIDHHTGDHVGAIGHYRQALALYRELGHTYQAANTLDRLGHPHVALGQHDEARAVWREALALYRRLGRAHDAERVQAQIDAC